MDREQFKAEVFRQLLSPGGGFKEARAALEVRLETVDRMLAVKAAGGDDNPTSNPLGVAWGQAQKLMLLGLGGGAAVGFAGRRMFDPGPEDIKEIGNQQLVDAYRSETKDLQAQRSLRDLAGAQKKDKRRLLL